MAISPCGEYSYLYCHLEKCGEKSYGEKSYGEKTYGEMYCGEYCVAKRPWTEFFALIFLMTHNRQITYVLTTLGHIFLQIPL